MSYPSKIAAPLAPSPTRRLANGHVLALASTLPEYPSECAPEQKSEASEYVSAPLIKPLLHPARRSRWSGFAEPIIFAAALLAGLLAVSQWFSELPT
ncbi:MAG: hypothetical protein M3Y32_12620, partial [Pseudomonadota bacterium]|nr:hypothetical protein [Pseudomonadota bacterium]